ncbi:hypothetical protein S7711_02747 [Stachybotrys chartarum IBT 7711]|uniref:Uncharacterized protein n=1 Tax=Stachybotrys chartarum (strain CBS 109288 / IBT 7711) TaxID=1280523 RepID=A0A084ALV4_STACB|nr:hypothetical protein S7711_02747 [Stachybotrys chartarum IBT 7711]
MSQNLLLLNNTYVIHYEFSDLDVNTAAEQFAELCQDLEQAGLRCDVRPGDDESLLIFAKAPPETLKPAVLDLRVKDYLFGITSTHPPVESAKHGVEGDNEAEDLLSMYHLVSWPKSSGGAAITPEFGRWQNVKSIFPIHNSAANKALLRRFSKRLFLSHDDLDQIRSLFGVKVAFYFAYMQTYLAFLLFPALTGIYAWFFLPKYSLIYSVITLLGCTVFLEYWKIKQSDLAIRWNVQGVGRAKVNRANFQSHGTTVDDAGRIRHHFPKRKYIARQMLQVPFFILALICLGVVISLVFSIEVLISEVYDGAYKFYLQYLPTILLAVCIPYINSFFEDVAGALAEYENHRTQDYYEMSLSQKIFVLSFITNYLPIFLTAFVYVPMGDSIMSYLVSVLQRVLSSGMSKHLGISSFQQEPDRLRDEVIALTVTGQLSDMVEELILPFFMHRARRWYRKHQHRRAHGTLAGTISPDDPSERAFLQEVRRQASLPSYDVQADISEMVIQFGYLALFSPVWPLISIGFVINNWIELRSDFFKICNDHRRPHPTRTDGLGPWIASLDTLAVLGSISTGAIVHMFGATLAHNSDASNMLTILIRYFPWWTLPVTIFFSEHMFLVLRAGAQFMLRGLGSRMASQERKDKYARRKRRWDSMVGGGGEGRSSIIGTRELKVDVDTTKKRFGNNQAQEHGVSLIRLLKQAKGGISATKQD